MREEKWFSSLEIDKIRTIWHACWFRWRKTTKQTRSSTFHENVVRKNVLLHLQVFCGLNSMHFLYFFSDSSYQREIKVKVRQSAVKWRHFTVFLCACAVGLNLQSSRIDAYHRQTCISTLFCPFEYEPPHQRNSIRFQPSDQMNQVLTTLQISIMRNLSNWKKLILFINCFPFSLFQEPTYKYKWFHALRYLLRLKVSAVYSCYCKYARYVSLFLFLQMNRY